MGLPLGSCTCAPLALVNWTLVSALVGVLALVLAVRVTRRRPTPSRSVATPTGGRELQGAGVGVIVGVRVGVGVGGGTGRVPGGVYSSLVARGSSPVVPPRA